MKHKCRAKRIDTHEWIIGFIYEHEPPLQCAVFENSVSEKSKWYILQTAFADWNMPRQVDFIEVDPNTIGEFTYLTDQDETEIYDGDIVRLRCNRETTTEYTSEVVFGADGALVHAHPSHIKMGIKKDNEGRSLSYYVYCAKYDGDEEYNKGICKVIGNIYDNLELLTNT